MLKPGNEIIGPSQLEPLLQSLTGAFPDLTVEVETILVDETNARVRWSASVTHLGTAMGIAPTGNPIKVRA